MKRMQLIKTESFELAVNVYGDEKAEKIALLLPGRLDTKDYGNLVSHGEYLAKKGFFAVAMDPPGTWESPGEVSLFTTTNYIRAVRELIDYYGNRPTLLVGHSRGGAVAILAGDQTSEVFGIVAVMASFGGPSVPSEATVEAGFQMEYRDLPPGSEKTKEQKEFRLPLRYFTDGERYSIEAVLRKSTKPKLLFYGTEDEFTDPEVIKQEFAKMSKPKQLHELKCSHDYRYYPKMIAEVNEVVGEWVSNDLGFV